MKVLAIILISLFLLQITFAYKKSTSRKSRKIGSKVNTFIIIPILVKKKLNETKHHQIFYIVMLNN
jgi:hypothetical protein